MKRPSRLKRIAPQRPGSARIEPALRNFDGSDRLAAIAQEVMALAASMLREAPTICCWSVQIDGSRPAAGAALGKGAPPDGEADGRLQGPAGTVAILVATTPTMLRMVPGGAGHTKGNVPLDHDQHRPRQPRRQLLGRSRRPTCAQMGR